jgi:hypothetical protein
MKPTSESNAREEWTRWLQILRNLHFRAFSDKKVRFLKARFGLGQIAPMAFRSAFKGHPL